MNKADIIIWFDYPPVVEKGGFNALSEIWEGKVLYVINHDLREERKKTGWQNDCFGHAVVISLNDYSTDKRSVVLQSIFAEHPDAIHIANGFDTPIIKEIKPLLLVKGVKLLLFTERPTIMGGVIERILRRCYLFIKYTALCHEYRPYLCSLLPLGIQGVKRFVTYGVDKNSIYNFLYCPEIEDISNDRLLSVSNPIRFLYVGRFFYKTKGTDVILNAVRKLIGEWRLDMVGGYGMDSEEVLTRISNEPNINYIGSWNSQDVVRNIQNYDVVVVPSRADGWNLLVNEALHAGVAVIASDEAVSHEVLERFDAGLVFKSGRSGQLAKCMQRCIDDSDMVIDLMRNGRKATPYICRDVIGRYIKEIIDYEIYHIGNKPKCPWL